MTEPKTTTSRAAKADAKPTSIVPIISRISAEAGALRKTQDPNSGVKFPFRGIDAVINHLAPHLDEYGVITTSRITNKTTERRDLPGGKAITQTDITVEYTFHAPDGSSVTTEVVGLAQDYADRSAAQAMSVAYRVALLQLFHLPTDSPEPEVAGEDTQRYIEKNAAAAPKLAAKAQRSADELRAEISGLMSAHNIDGSTVNALLADISGTKEYGKWTEAHLEAALTKLREQVAQ